MRGIMISLIIYYSIFQSAQAATLQCYDGSLDNFQSTPLEDPVPLLDSCIYQTRPTVFYAFGHNQTPDDDDVKTILQAYLDTDTVNVILVNWEKEASEDGHLGSTLGYVAFSIRNTKKVGEDLGKAIKDLVDAGLNKDNIHCVGHSLGAQLMGAAGKTTKNDGLLLPRVTGLDPAGPIYDLPLAQRLDKDCAEFVDVIHTNKGGYGTTLPLGKVNFWVNPSSDLEQMQPGCSAADDEALCSHQRSVYIYAEAVASSTALPAAGPTDYDTWAADKYTGGHIYIGEDTDTQAAAGDYYLTTNDQSPYSKGEAGLNPS